MPVFDAKAGIPQFWVGLGGMKQGNTPWELDAASAPGYERQAVLLDGPPVPVGDGVVRYMVQQTLQFCPATKRAEAGGYMRADVVWPHVNWGFLYSRQLGGAPLKAVKMGIAPSLAIYGDNIVIHLNNIRLVDDESGTNRQQSKLWRSHRRWQRQQTRDRT